LVRAGGKLNASAFWIGSNDVEFEILTKSPRRIVGVGITLQALLDRKRQVLRIGAHAVWSVATLTPLGIGIIAASAAQEPAAAPLR
jgi:hypothetical protein